MAEKSAGESPHTLPMPISARVHLAHALVQWLADSAGVDLLHIKGPAVLPGLRDAARMSSDVDVLVRPDHLARLIDVLEEHGWERRTHFATGSPFAHAANWWHDDWGWTDVHVSWPGAGADPAEVFDVLAASGTTQVIAHVACPVPDEVGQRLILLLHSARTPDAADRERTWDVADDTTREAVRALAARLDAEVALAAAIGELDRFRNHPEHDLWAHFSQGGGTRIQEWRARLRASRGLRAKATLIASVARVNRDHLGLELGREPQPHDVRRQQAQRVRQAWREVRAVVRSRGEES